MLNPSSSRGVHGSLGWGKPDVAAPGTQILSARVRLGQRAAVPRPGTSMATPHVAGIAALVVAAHPGWNVAQVKSAVVNTATHDVTTGPNGTGLVTARSASGSGRVDAVDAVATNVIAYNTQARRRPRSPGASCRSGRSTVVQKKTVTVQNFGTTSQRFDHLGDELVDRGRRDHHGIAGLAHAAPRASPRS